MTSRDFCFWLQGYFEVRGAGTSPGVMDPCELDVDQVAVIRRHLALVFLHEIDPSAGSPAHQEKLNEAHGGPVTRSGEKLAEALKKAEAPGQPIYRC